MFTILELQTNNGITNVVTPIKTAETRNDAFSKYHGILFAAAISSVDTHTAMIIDAEGKTIARESYVHGAEPDEVTE